MSQNFELHNALSCWDFEDSFFFLFIYRLNVGLWNKFLSLFATGIPVLSHSTSCCVYGIRVDSDSGKPLEVGSGNRECVSKKNGWVPDVTQVVVLGG